VVIFMHADQDELSVLEAKRLAGTHNRVRSALRSCSSGLESKDGWNVIHVRPAFYRLWGAALSRSDRQKGVGRLGKGGVPGQTNFNRVAERVRAMVLRVVEREIGADILSGNRILVLGKKSLLMATVT
jgi:hypothetical protein